MLSARRPEYLRRSKRLNEGSAPLPRRHIVPAGELPERDAGAERHVSEAEWPGVFPAYPAGGGGDESVQSLRIPASQMSLGTGTPLE